MSKVEYEPGASEGNGAPSEQVTELVNKIKEKTQEIGMVNVLMSLGIDYSTGDHDEAELLKFREAAMILSMEDDVEFKKIGDGIRKIIGGEQH